jgi:basic membrane protein A
MVFATQADLKEFAPNYWLTGSRWNWDKAYCDITKEVQERKWKPNTLWLGMKDGTVELSSIGKLVPKDVEKQTLAIAEQIRRGQKAVFKGPLKDREGRQRLAAGQVCDQKMLSEMDWFVEGVEGALPKK